MNRFLKKIFVAIGIFFCLALLAAIIIPRVVDVDKYRPQIEQAADQHLNGRLELGKLSLSLWGQIRIEVGGLKILDTYGRQVVAVNDVYFHVPLSSLLGGAPDLILVMRRPELSLVKDRAGKLNLLTLVKTSPEASSADQGQATPAPSGGTTGRLILPGIATRARMGVELTQALVNYRDESSAMTAQVKDLNLIVHDISLGHEMTARIWADLDTEMQAAGKGGGMAMKGPVRLTLTGRPSLAGNHFDHMDLSGHLSLDDLDIRYGDLFHKAKGVAAHADLATTVSPAGAKVEALDMRFFNAELKGQGDVTTAAAGGAAAPAQVDFSMKSNVIELKPWSQLVPMLNDYQLGGNASLEASAHGPSDRLGYKAFFKINDLTAKAPKLKAEPRIDALVSIVTDQIDHLTLTMSAPGNELKVHGKVVSFTKPRADFEITSGGLDLDQLIEFPPPGSASKAQEAPAGGGGGGGATSSHGAEQADYDAMIAPLRENKILRDTVANLGVSIRSIRAQGVLITDVASKMSFRDRVAGIDQFGMKLFGGAVRANAQLDMKPRMPAYRFGANVESLDLRQAVASQYHLFRNTLLGKANFSVNGTGESLNPTPAINRLNAKGKLRVDNATFATIDVTKMVMGALNGAIAQVRSRIPGIGGKAFSGPPGGGSEYQYISTDFTIANGKFKAPDLVAKAAPNKGIDLKGATEVGLNDYSLKTSWEVIDTYNLTHAKDQTVPGTNMPLLAEKGQPVKFPISAGCTLKAPCYSYSQVPEYLVKVAMNNMTGAARGRAQAELQKQAGSLIKQAPPQVQKQLNDLGKKLFGR